MYMYIARVKAKYDHFSSGADQLRFLVGDEIIVLEESEEFKGLWRGKNELRGEGLFPSNYVEEITEGTQYQ